MPERLDPDERTDWTPVWSYAERRQRFLPSAMLFYSYPVPGNRYPSWADSNGAAAGSCFEDAFLQGLFELVERDSVAVWWYNRLARSEVDLGRVDYPFLTETRACYERIGRKVWVLDLTTDLGIPSYVAINQRMGGPTEDIMMGFGAHLVADIGIMRAVTEMNPFMPAGADHGPDGRTIYGFDDPDSLRRWPGATLANQPYLAPSGGVSGNLATGRTAGADLTETLREAIARVEARGHEVLALDQTRIDIGLPVVKVFAPGLRHFWARLAPGRLCDVPIAMKDLRRPLTEAELNPIAMFL